jgi:hypothetical protein
MMFSFGGSISVLQRNRGTCWHPNTVKILYVDESYDKRRYVVCGFLINDINYRKLNETFNRFLEKELGLPEDEELKGDELFNGRNHWRGHTMQQRAEWMTSTVQYLAATKGTSFLLAQRSPDTTSTHEEDYLALLDAIIKKSASIVSKLGKTNRQLLLVFDERHDIDRAIHETVASRKHEIVRNLGKSCTVIDNGYEGISKYSRMLQIADFVAYSYHNYCCLNDCSTLFEQKTDDRKLDMFKGFFETTLKAKCKIVHAAT